ncbi:transcription antitermination factor NusB [Mycoplasma testudineum]|nr:transcription antitermination factor NusB [Mycoplasma testudineum]
MKNFIEGEIKYFKWQDARVKRYFVISVIYRYYLLEQQPTIQEIIDVYDPHENELKLIEFFFKTKSQLEKMIYPFLKNSWNWNSMLPILKSIIVYSILEIKLFKRHQIVISEALEISKSLLTEKEAKFVNAILDSFVKASETYVKQKSYS